MNNPSKPEWQRTWGNITENFSNLQRPAQIRIFNNANPSEANRLFKRGIFAGMIQRIQTLLLAVSAISLGLLLIVPFAHEPLENGSVFGHSVLSGFQNGVEAYQTWATVCLALITLAVLLSISTILQYRNRKRQLGLILVLYLLIVGVAFCVHTMAGTFALDVVEEASRGIGYFLPVVALICAFLASYFIRRDERLVKSLDRIR